MTRITTLGAGMLLTAVLATGCTSGGATSAPSTESAPTAGATSEPSPSIAPSASAVDFTGCLVVSPGGVFDKGFNQSAWTGLQAAAQEFGIEAKYLDSKAVSDYEKNISTFMREGCDLIVAVGYEMADAVTAAATTNVEQKFAIVDFAYDPPLPNVLGLTFQTDQAGMLGGYLASSVSSSGVLGTFGGQDIPPVWDWINGLYAGMQYYNEQAGKDVRLIGADPISKQGTFVGDWFDKDKGGQIATSLFQEGADVILPIAGPAGLGALTAAQESGAMAFGVDTDQAESAPEYKSVLLSSLLKRVDTGVREAVSQSLNGDFTSTVWVGNLANEGVGLAPFHDFDSKVSPEVKAGLADLSAKIASGEVSVQAYLK